MNVRDHERIRRENIQKNKELLLSLGLDKPAFEPKQKKRAPAAPKPKPALKRNASNATSDSEDEEDKRPKKKVQRATKTAVNDEDGASADAGPRRSGRNAGKTIDYNSESLATSRMIVEPVSVKARRESNYGGGPEGRSIGKRIHDPKTYGSIPGVAVGTWWPTREGCSVDAIHASWVGGITVGKHGAFSVALSGGYEDDVDLGYAFTYTGSGGRDLKGTKAKPKNLRTAPQSSDQTFENVFNKALKKSSETKKPIRVIRGFKLKSKYAPVDGYRYDGLYVVEKAWLEKGMNANGYLVCKFALKRLPGQEPLEVNEEFEQKAAAAADEEEDVESANEAEAEAEV